MPDTSDGTNGTGRLKCPCVTCIVMEAREHEERKRYKEADLALKKGLEYYSSVVKQLEEELKKFNVRTKYNSSSIVSTTTAGSSNKTQESIQFTHCQHLTHGSVAKTKEFTCPVAIFDSNGDPKLKPMYPKNVVYFDGNDHQLEEIRAARYWTDNKLKSSLKNEKIPDNLRRIISSEQFISFTKYDRALVEETGQNLIHGTNVLKVVHSPITKSKPLRCSTEIENIDPNARQTLEIVEDSVKLVSKNAEKPSTLGAKNQISLSSRISEEISKSPAQNQTFTLKSPEKAGTSQRNTVSSTDRTLFALNESTICNSSEDLRLKSKVSPTIASVNSLIAEDGSRLEKLSSMMNVSEQPTVSIDPVCKDNTRERSKIPTLKKFLPNVQSCQAGASQQDAVCSKTFVVAKPNPSETYIVKPESKIARGNPSETYVLKPFDIDKETLTLVQDDYDDLDSCPLPRRTSQLFKPTDTCHAAIPPSSLGRPSIKPPDMDSSTTEAFHIALPSSTPNKRMSQFFREPTVEPNEIVYSAPPSAPLRNLSTITEMSKEQYSSSLRPSQKTPLETINEAERSGECSKNDSVELIPDPFDVELIERLLQKIQFPQPHHLDGYNKINAEMAQMKLSSLIKLGNNKYTISAEIGKGNYARILKLQNKKEPGKFVALKQQKPACLWEYYISKEIQRRLKNDSEKSYFIQYTDIFVYLNGSVMISSWAQYGSILNFVNNLKMSPYHENRCPMAVAVWLSIQFAEAIQYLHSCDIIHADVKPDNFVLYDEIATDRACVKLIDYGRAIDMRLLPKNVAFNKVVTTEDYTCNEMKDNRPWTYQTDLFGLASTIYLLLVGEYMKTEKKSNGKWTLKKNFPRYVNRELWNPIFDYLLNIPSCTELPDLVAIRRTLEADFNSIDQRTITQQFTNIGALLKK